MHHKNVGKYYSNDKNTSHNHCQCLLLYKLAEHSTSGLGRFSECRKCTWYMYTHNALGRCKLLRVVCIYQKKHKCLCYNIYLWFLCSLKKSKKFHHRNVQSEVYLGEGMAAVAPSLQPQEIQGYKCWYMQNMIKLINFLQQFYTLQIWRLIPSGVAPTALPSSPVIHVNNLFWNIHQVNYIFEILIM